MATAKPVQLDIEAVKQQYAEELENIELTRKAALYLSAAQIYLKDNVWLKEKLSVDHIKPRQLGHWGTCPGLILAYVHYSRLVRDNKLDGLFVTGPGHGAPAILSCLFMEGSLERFYPEKYPRNKVGFKNLVKSFSWPGGFPSHVNPEVPGSIHEGGELGYALAVAVGSVLDYPDLITTVIVGDGEAETGPTATAWHSIKYIDPISDGAIIPILHLNKYKIASISIFGSMSEEELLLLFSGYGYAVRFVHAGDGYSSDADMWASIEWAFQEIRNIQQAARSGKPVVKPKWPLLILKSPKGWTVCKEIDGKPLEGSYHSHQVPIPDVLQNQDHLRILEQWLHSYKIEELVDKEGNFLEKVVRVFPKNGLQLGSNPKALGGPEFVSLTTPNINDYELKSFNTEHRGSTIAANMSQLALYLKEVIKNNQTRFRIFSPDELESNRLGAVLEITHRNFEWPVNEKDEHIGPRGRVMEMLSEHTLQGWMQGYTLTGRYGLFPSYEAFTGIITTMMDQYAKFLKVSLEVEWRKDVPGFTYIESSTLWRQEHNGFSHQNPGFINTLLNKKSDILRVYLPADAHTAISVMDHCLRSKNKINLVITSKQQMPQWLTMKEAKQHCRAGASVWRFASTFDGVDPDVVLVGIGAEPTQEVLIAASMLREQLPKLRVRVVNVVDLMILDQTGKHPHALSPNMFESLFTKDRPVIINFHGYQSAIKQLLFEEDAKRFQINGYIEEGTTTTPLDMLVVNGVSRHHIVRQAVSLATPFNPSIAPHALDIVSFHEYRLREFKGYIQEFGQDPQDMMNYKFNF